MASDHSDILTDDTFDKVDTSLGRDTVTLARHASAYVELPKVLQRVGFVAVASLPPLNERSPYLRSHWVMREDGRCMPMLHALALVRFGEVSSEPYWADKNPENMSLSNVSRTSGAAKPRQSFKRYKKSPYGRAGTPEYQRNYYARNRARIQKKRRALRAKQSQSTSELDALSRRLLADEQSTEKS